MISLKPTLFVSFRAHTGPVLSLTVSPNGDFCFSGGVDNTIRCWNLPSSNIDPYDSFGKSRLPSLCNDCCNEYSNYCLVTAISYSFFYRKPPSILPCSRYVQPEDNVIMLNGLPWASNGLHKHCELCYLMYVMACLHGAYVTKKEH